MMMKRKSTMTAPAVTRICTAARKKALSMTKSARHEDHAEGEAERAGHRVAVEDDREAADDHARPRRARRKRRSWASVRRQDVSEVYDTTFSPPRCYLFSSHL